jgi:hypothetical protein
VPFWRRGRDRAADGVPVDGEFGSSTQAPTPEQPESSEVEEAMRKVAEHDTAESRRALFELLLGSTLFAATATATASASPREAEQRLAWLDSEAGPVLPVFTRSEALFAWSPSGYTAVAVTGRALFEMAARSNTARIEVNPASVPRGWISRTEIEALAEGRVPPGPRQDPTPEGETTVGPPAVRPPDALVDAARRALETQPHVVAGWLFATEQGGGPSQLMVGVQLARGLDEAATRETMQAIVEETWARSTDADRLRFMVVAQRSLYDTLRRGGGELIFKR